MVKKICSPGNLDGKLIPCVTGHHRSRGRTRKDAKVNHPEVRRELPWSGPDKVLPVVADEEYPVPGFNHGVRAS